MADTPETTPVQEESPDLGFLEPVPAVPGLPDAPGLQQQVSPELSIELESLPDIEIVVSNGNPFAIEDFLV